MIRIKSWQPRLHSGFQNETKNRGKVQKPTTFLDVIRGINILPVYFLKRARHSDNTTLGMRRATGLRVHLRCKSDNHHDHHGDDHHNDDHHHDHHGSYHDWGYNNSRIHHIAACIAWWYAACRIDMTWWPIANQKKQWLNWLNQK